MHAIEKYQIDKFAIAGGVASNGTLRGAMEEECRKRNVAFYHPSPILCTDNAAMIGAAAVSYTHLDVYKRQQPACIRKVMKQPESFWKN